MAKYLDEAGVIYLIDKIVNLLNEKVDKEEGKALSSEDFSPLLKEKLETLKNYSLPVASHDNLGGIKVGNGLVINTETGELTAVGDSNAEAEAAAERASQSAIVAGNYAAQAIQAQQAIENKIWYGTMEEYNALETINSSTIYIILHE